ncbi:hypothetical protein HDU97_010070 [Phlyctochytrium planicorne]|nr:hypothetical protein HDU97_010070 [Phlyctochytrium planicorne]
MIQLFKECEVKFRLTESESCLVFPSRRCAVECRDFKRRHSPDPTYSSTIRIAEYTLALQHTATSPDASDPITCLLAGPAILYIVIFQKELAAIGKRFWQHSGEGVSARFASFCLRVIEKNRRAIDFSGDEKDGKKLGSSQRYLQYPNNADDQHAMTDLALQESSKSEMDVFVEERYGRNLDLRTVQHAKTVLKKRIAGVLGDDDKVQGTANDSVAYKLRNLDSVNESHVFLFPSGMSAIYNAHRLITKLRPSQKTVQFGFPYLDTLKIQERFGSGCHFFGNGDQNDLEELQALLESGSSSISALFCEFPSNPLLKSVDIRKLRDLANKHNFLIVIDETIGNFVNVSVLEFADIVVSSLTKIFSGDCNVMGGSTINQIFEDNVWCEDAVFLERNSRTFVDRIKVINENAILLANYLDSHPKVVQVHYPLFTDRPMYDSVRRNDGGYGGLLSIILEDEASAKRFYDNLHVAKGPSLGTNFTLASPYTILAHYTELDWAKTFNVCRWLVRVSVGLEPSEELVQTFAKALDSV